MELTTFEAAQELGMSQRQVQRLVDCGRLAGRAVAGRTVVGGRSVLAARRSAGRGRRWADGVASAALELMEIGSTDRLMGRELSRTMARLGEQELYEIAYHVLGARVTLWRRTRPGGAVTALTGLSQSGSGLDVVVSADASTYARRERLIEDTDGDTVIVELTTRAHETLIELALYAYGDSRTSAVARDLLGEKLARLR